MVFDRFKNKQIAVLITCALLSACSQVSPGGNESAPQKAETPEAAEDVVAPPDVKFADVLETVFSAQCTFCHSSLNDYNQAKAMLLAIQDRVFVRKTMPPGGSLTDQQQSILKEWIQAGGPL